MKYDHGDSFPFDFEPNESAFGSKSKGKLSPRSYHIQCERKWNTSFLSTILERNYWGGDSNLLPGLLSCLRHYYGDTALANVTLLSM